MNRNTDRLLSGTLSSHTHAIIFILVFTIAHEADKLGTGVSPFLEVTKLKPSMPEATRAPTWQTGDWSLDRCWFSHTSSLQDPVPVSPARSSSSSNSSDPGGSPGPGSRKGMRVLLNVLEDPKEEAEWRLA